LIIGFTILFWALFGAEGPVTITFRNSSQLQCEVVYQRPCGYTFEYCKGYEGRVFKCMGDFTTGGEYVPPAKRVPASVPRGRVM